MSGRQAKKLRKEKLSPPERGRALRVGLVTGALVPLAATSALALPQGGTVASGSATVSTPTATSMRIDQATDRLIMDWTRFNIAANESVRFQQPSAASVALNRVMGQEPSSIFGSLSANGQIFLINPSGILFGAGSRVDVGALTASTLNLSNQDFLAGRYRFTQDPAFPNAGVMNQGVITAGPGGYVALLGAAARNEGVIQAQLGSIAMAAGRAATLDMRGDGLIQFVVTDAVSGAVNAPDGKSLASYVSNTGTLQADGGMVTMQAKAAADVIKSAVNQEGVVRAASLVNRGGVIKLVASDDVENAGAIGWQANLGKVHNASGTVTNYGMLDVSAGEAGAAQGQVTLAGEYVGHAGTILARGADQASGGRVLLTSSKETVVTKTGSIDTSGIGNSSGGNTVVWSDKDTIFQGDITAKGGASAGNGGNVEVSGYENLNFRGTADLSATNGRTGTLLLDPANITITAGTADGAGDGTSTFAGSPSGATGTITFADASPTTVYQSELQNVAANIVLQASQNITVSGNFGGCTCVSIPNNRNITLETRNQVGDGAGGIDLTGSAHGNNFEIKTQGTGTITINGSTNGGAAGNVTLTKLTTAGGSISVSTNNGTITLNNNLTTPGGAISLTGAVALGANVTVDSTNAGGTAAGANISFSSTINADSAANNRTLTLAAGTAGNVSVTGAVGGTQPLQTFTVSSGSNATLPAITTRDGGISVTSQYITLNGNLSTDSTVTAGAVGLVGAVTLGADVTIDTDAATTDANITIPGQIDGAHALTLVAGGGTIALGQASQLFNYTHYLYDTNFSNTYDFNSAFSLAIWVRRQGSSGPESAFSNWEAGNNNGLFLDFDHAARFVYRNNGSNVFDFTQTATLDDGAWHHVVAVYDPSLGSANAKVYYDGVQQSVTANASTTFAITGQQLRIGSLDGTNRIWANEMAQAQIYNKALSSSEVAQIMTRPGSVTSNMKAWWPLFGLYNANASTEPDYSGNGATMTRSWGPYLSTTQAPPVVTVGSVTAPTSFTISSADTDTLHGIRTAGTLSITGTNVTLGGLLSTTSNGNISVTAASSLTIANTITANGSGTVTLTATGGSSDITTSKAIDSGSGLITLQADDDITLNSGGTVGAATTGAITIAADNDGSTAGTLTTSAAIGNASAAGAITLSGADMALGTTVTGSGAVTLKPSTASRTIGIAGGAGNFALSTTEIGYLTDGFSSVTIGRADGTGLVTINGVTFTDPVTIQSAGVAGAITLSGALTTAAANAPITLIAGTGDSGTFTQTAGAGNTIASGSGAITITADSIVLNTSANTITGTGAITLQPATASRPIVIGAAGAATDFALSTTEVAALTNGFSGITIGRSDSSGAVTVSATTFNDPVTIQSPAGSGTVTVNGAITGAGNSSVTLTGGTGATPISLNAGITTAGSTITLNDNVGLGANVTLDATNAGGSAGGATIAFAGTINADSAANDRTITLKAGTAGNITFGGAVGGTQALKTFTVTNGNNVTLPAITTRDGGINVTATAITLSGNLSTDSITTAGAVTLTGPVTLGANITVDTDAATTDANISFSSTINADSAGNDRTLTLVAGTGTPTLSGAVGGTQALKTFTISSATAATLPTITTRDGGISVTATNITLGGDLSTNSTATAGAVSLIGAVTLTGNRTITTDAATTDANMSFSSTINADSAANDRTLTLTAGGANVTLSGAVGGTQALKTLTITSANNATLGAVTTRDGGISVTATAVTLTGNLSTDAVATAGALSLGGGAVTLGGNVTIDTDATTTDANISFGSTVNADSAANDRTLTLTAGGANVTLSGAVGGSQALKTFAVNSANSASLPAITTRDGGISVTANAITLNGNLATNSTATAGPVALTGAMTLGTDVTITTDAATTDANITLSGSIDGAHALTLTAGSGNVTVQSGSRSFDGTDDYVEVSGNPFNFERTDTFTVAAWINTSDGADKEIISRNLSSGAYTGWEFMVESNYVRAHLINDWGGGNKIVKGSAANPIDGAWHHVAFTYDGSSTAAGLNIYVDGVLSNGTTFNDNLTTSMATAAQPLRIGAWTGAAHVFTGNIADVQIFNSTLNASQISQIKAAPGSVTSGLIGFWPLLGGTTEADRSGGGNSGTPTNGAAMSSASPSTAILTAGYASPLTSLTATGNAITINGVTTTGAQSYTAAGTGTLNGPLTTTSNGSIAVTTAAALTVSQAITANGSGTVTLTATGGASNITSSGAINSDSGLISLLADNNITLNSGGTVGASTTGAITIAADNDGSGAGTLTTSAAIGNASAAGAITLSGADIALGAPVTGSGALTLQPSTASSSIGAAGGAGSFALSTAEIAQLTDGFSSITVGRADGSGAVVVNAVTFNDPVTIQSPAGSGTVTVNGAITGAGNSSVTLTGGTGATPISLNAGITTAGSTITLNDNVGLGANVTLDATNAGGSAGGATIAFAGTINADSAANDRTITLKAGTAGNITFGGAVGGTQALKTFTVTNGNNVTLPAITTRDGGINVTATAITLSGNLSTDSITTAGAVTLTGPVTLGANITVDTDAATTDANISFSSTINADSAGNDRTLTLVAGTGTPTLSGAVGGTQALKTFTISSATAATLPTITTRDGGISVTATNITLGGDLSTNSTATAGAVSLIGAVTLTGNRTITTDAATTDANMSFSSTINADSAANDRTLTLTAGGANVTLSGAVGGTQALKTLTITSANNATLGAVTTRSGGISVTATNISLDGNLSTDTQTTAGAVALTGAVGITGSVTIDTDAATTDANTTITGSLSTSGTVALMAGTGTVSVVGDFTESAGTFTAPSGTMNVSGNFTHSGGVFTHNSGTVVLNGTNQTLSGATTFNNLTKTVASAATLTFPSGASNTQTIVGTLTLQGTSGQLLTLASDVPGTQWQIDPQGTRTINYLSVSDSKNINTMAIDARGMNTTNGGNNIGWIFDGTANFTWIGLGADNDWTTAANWVGGVPGAGDSPIFNGTSIKNSTVNAGFGGTITDLNINSGYTGTIDLARSLTVNGSYTQAAGTFTAGNNNVSINSGVYTLSGGTFNAPSGTLGLSNFSGSVLGFTISGGTFNHNNGTVQFSGNYYPTADVLANQHFNNVTVALTNGFSAQFSVANGKTMTVDGTVTLTSGYLGNQGAGTIDALGSVSVGGSFLGSYRPQGTLLLIDGAGDQSFVVSSGAALPRLTLNNNLTTISFAGDATINGDFTLQAGTFTAPSGTLTVTTIDASSLNFTISGGTFNHNSGTVVFSGNDVTANVPANQPFNNVTVSMWNNTTPFSIANGATMTVNGALALSNGLLGSGSAAGTLNAKGSVSVAAAFAGSKVPYGTLLLIDGAGNQSFVVPDGALLPKMTLNSNLTTISFAPGATSWLTGDFTLQAGTFTAPSGTLYFVDYCGCQPFFTISGGTFNHNNGTVVLTGQNVGVNVPSNQPFKNLTVSMWSDANPVTLAGGTVTVTGTFTHSNGVINNGTVAAQGDVTIDAGADGGNVALTFSGGAAETYTDNGGAKTSGAVTVNKTVGSAVTLATDMSYNNGGQNLTVTSGTLDLAGHDLTVNNALTVAAAGTLQLQGAETITDGSLALNAGSTVRYNGTAASYTLKNYSYSNLTIDGDAATVFSFPADLTTINTLTLNNSITSLAGHNLTATTLVNNATLRLQGNEAITLTNGNDTAEGLWEYVGDGAGGVASFTIKDWGATDYYNLKINPTDTSETYTVSSPLKLNSALTHLGGTLNLGASVTTVGGSITSNGPVTLSANVTVDTTNGGGTPAGATMTFTGAIDADAAGSNRTLTLTAGTSNVSLSAAVGGGQALQTFSVTSANSASLPAITTRSGGISVTATTITLGGNLSTDSIATAGAVSLVGAVSLTGNRTIDTDAATTDANISFSSTVNADAAGNDRTLTLVAGGGDVTLGGAVGGVQAVKTLTVSSANNATLGAATTRDGGISVTATNITLDGNLSTDSIATAGAVSLVGAVMLTGNSTIDTDAATTDANISFSSTINGAQNLTLTAGGGDVAIGGIVGGTTPLTSLTASGNAISLQAVTTTSAQTYTGTTTLNGTLIVNAAGAGVSAGSVTLAAGGGSITLTGSNAANDVTLGTVNGAQALAITAGGGDIVLGAVGGSTPLTTVTLSGNTAALQAVTTSGAQSYSGVTTTTLNGTLLVNTLGAGVSAGNVSLAAGGGTITLTGSNGANDVTLGTVNGAQALAVTAGGGDIVLGAVGGSTPLSTVTLSGNTASLQAVTTSGAQSYSGVTTTTLNGTLLVNTQGAGVSAGAVSLAAGGGVITLTGSNAANDVTLGTVNGAQALAITAGGGDIVLGAVGGSTPLSAVTLSGNTASLQAVTTSGAQSYSGVTTTTLNGTLLVNTQGAGVSAGNVSLAAGGGTITLTGSNAANDVTLGTVNGAQALAITAGGGDIVLGAVGGSTPLTTVTLSGNTAALQAVTTSGAQSYSGVTTTTLNGTLLVNTQGAGVSAGNVTLAAGGGAITLTGSNAANDVTLGTVNGAQALNVTAGGGDIVLGTVGGSTRLASVTASGNTISLQAVSTTGAQSYSGTTTLNGNLNSNTAGAIAVTGAANLATGAIAVQTAGGAATDDITFSSTINGGQALTLTAGAGDVLVSGIMGGTTPLSSLTASGNTVTVQAVTTTGAQSYTGTTTLNGDLTTTNSAITLNSATTITAPLTLSAGTGTVTAGATVAAGANALIVTADEINLSGGANSVTGTSTLVLRPATTSLDIALGGPGGTGALDLTAAEVATLGNGFSGITIGRVADGTGTVTISPITFQTPLTIVGGAITADGLSDGSNAVTLTARTADIQGNGGGPHVTAGTLTINAVSGIGSATQLATSGVTSLTAATSGGGAASINVANTGAATTTLASVSTVGTGAGITVAQSGGGAVTATSVTTTDGAITLSNTGGNLTATSVTAGGAGRNVTLTTTGSGNITAASVSAVGDTITASSAGDLQGSGAGPHLSAATLNLTAANGIGNSTQLISSGATTMTVATTGAGAASINVANTSGSTTTVSSGTTVGAGANITLTQSGAGGFTVTTASTTDGAITLSSANGALTIPSLTAGGTGRNITATATTGDVVVGTATASGDTVTLTAGSAITDSNGGANNITAANLVASAGTGVATTGNPLETVISNLEATGGTGGVFVSNTGALTIGGIGAMVGVSATGTDIRITAASPMTVTEAVTTDGAGVITLTTGATGANDDLTVNAALTAATGAITLTSGDAVVLGANVSTGGNVLITAGTAITRSAGTVSGSGVLLDAATGIGTSGAPVHTAATTLAARTTTSGGIFISEADGATIGTVNGISGVTTAGNGNIELSAGGALALVQGVSAAGAGAVTLTATGAITGSGGIGAGGDLTLNASSVGSVATPLTLTTIGGQLSGTLSGTLATDVYNVKSLGASILNLGVITATSGGVGHAVTIDSSFGSILHVHPGTDITGGRVNFWGNTIGLYQFDLVVVTDNPPVYCNGTPCGLPYFVNGSSALFGLSNSLPDNVQYLLTGWQPETAELLTSGILPDNVYGCLDEDKEKVTCMAGALWGEKPTRTSVPTRQPSPSDEPKLKYRVTRVSTRH